ncbi:MAG: peptidylprolyl isomerase [Neisseria sp.]|uniref:peptidylprolyl isomerase n=1 Tax=Neisseria sp. TaxID=192066 RepID=UPI0026DBFE37|nr:peptidylprolyl isomerase [Neisseria sp.]MDO4642133.1 peptidylprolyl isomerase [Neisseria sp.]
MKTKVLLTSLGLALTSMALAAPTIDKARIDSMSTLLLKQAEQNPQAQPGNIDGAEIRKVATQRVQIMEVLKNEAIKNGLNKDSAIQAQLKNLEAEVYANAYTEYLEKKAEIDESDVRKLYDQIAKTVKIQQVIFDTPAEAKAAQELLLKGLSFDDLVKRYPKQSKSTDSFISPQDLDPEIGKIISTMARGEVTKEPITLNGKFYLVKLAAEGRNPQVPPFEQIKNQLISQAKQQKVQEQIMQLLKSNGINP